MTRLAAPAMEFARSYLEALREGFVRGDGSPMTEAQVREVEAGIEDLVREIPRRDAGEGSVACPDGVTRPRVPGETLWLVEGAEFLGEVNLRHRLNGFLERYGGHVGYGIRPSRRRQGHGTRILALALERFRALGLPRVLVTCAETNLGSRRIIEANGGVLEEVASFPWADGPVCRFWIELEGRGSG